MHLFFIWFCLSFHPACCPLKTEGVGGEFLLNGPNLLSLTKVCRQPLTTTYFVTERNNITNKTSSVSDTYFLVIGHLYIVAECYYDV